MSQIFWRQREDARRGVPCLFLDRDGVVVEETDYLHRPRDVRLLDGARDLIALAGERGFAVGLVTNQAGVGRGYYEWAAFEEVQAELVRQLELGPEPFDFVAACGAHEAATRSGYRVADHPWRKPAAGMMTMALGALSLDAGRSVMVGDRLSDLQAASVAGVGRLVHVLTGHGGADRGLVERWSPPQGTLLLRDGLASAREWFAVSE